MIPMEIENFDGTKLNEGLEQTKKDLFDKLDSFNKYFTSMVNPVNNTYGVTEKINDKGILERTFKNADGKYRVDYIYEDRIIKSRHKLNDNSYKYIMYDDNGTGYLEKVYKKYSDKNNYYKDSECLLPNKTIKHNNVVSITDSNGRVINAKITDLSLKDTSRDRLDLDKTGKGYLDHDHRGHLIPDSFNGKNTLENIVPQLDDVNRRKIKEVEDLARKLKKDGHTVDYEIKVNYGDSKNPKRPTSFEPKITCDGKIHDLDPSLKKIFNNNELTNFDKVKTTFNEKVNVVKTTTIDAHGYGKEAALIASGLTFLTSTGENIKLVIEGQKDVDEMVVDIVQDTTMAGGFGYLEGFAEQAISNTMRNSSNQMLSGLAKTGIPGMVIDFGIKSYDSITDYAEGKIDEAELLYDLGSNATTTVAAFEAAKLGAALGSGLGPVGTFAGGLVGGMVGYCIASEAYVAVIDVGVAGAEYIGEKAMEFGQNCIDLANEYLPEFASDITDSLNDFASNFSLPFSF